MAANIKLDVISEMKDKISGDYLVEIMVAFPGNTKYKEEYKINYNDLEKFKYMNKKGWNGKAYHCIKSNGQQEKSVKL